jgi:hypothetical protein
MPDLIICLCKEDEDVKNYAKKYLNNKTCIKYFGCRKAAIEGQLKSLKNITDIIVTAHGSGDEIGESSNSFVDIGPKRFAELLNNANFGGNVYFDVCYGYTFGANVKKHLTCPATIYGAEGATDMEIDKSKCKKC